MKKVYDRTMFISNEELQKAKVIICITEGLKWESHDEEEEERIYTGLVRWSIVSAEDAVEIEKDLPTELLDECNEYLVLEFNDGTIVVFRNSHVDMFIR